MGGGGGKSPYKTNKNYKTNKIIKHPYCFIGYFQNLKYFNSIKDILLKEFTLKAPLDSKNLATKNYILDSSNCVSLHVRRGDYIELSDLFIVLDINYYINALYEVKKRLGNLNYKPIVFIFSNDISWCKTHLMQNLDSILKEYFNYEFIDNNDEGKAAFELELMKTCKHNIIANSSFSWWAAYLNTNPDKIVVCPAKFYHYTPGKSFENMEDKILKSEWIRI